MYVPPWIWKYTIYVEFLNFRVESSPRNICHLKRIGTWLSAWVSSLSPRSIENFTIKRRLQIFRRPEPNKPEAHIGKSNFTNFHIPNNSRLGNLVAVKRAGGVLKQTFLRVRVSFLAYPICSQAECIALHKFRE